MKFLFRWAFRLLILAVALGIGIILVKDKLLKEYTASSIRQKTGMDVRIGNLETGTLNPTVRMENLVLFNTADFGGSPFLTIPDLYVEYDTEALALQRVHFTLMRLEIAELQIVENEHGRTNLQELLGKLGPVLPAAMKIKGLSEPNFTGIDKLNLTVHKVKYTSMRHPGRSQEVEIDLKNELITNLRTEDDFYGVLMKVFLRAGITIYLDDHADKSAPASTLAAKTARP